MVKNDTRTLGYVLRRTNYGEADRILNLITPLGKMSVIAKGVRKEKSKLAGGIEMFSLTDFNIHQGRGNMGTVTGTKMIKYYSEILRDFNRLEIAGAILKKISLVSENSDNPEYFKITDQCLKGLNDGLNLGLIEGWFLLNTSRAIGEEINLYRDDKGRKLSAEKKYLWDCAGATFFESDRGDYGENEIKMLRMMVTVELKIASRIKIDEETMDKVLKLIRTATRV